MPATSSRRRRNDPGREPSQDPNFDPSRLYKMLEKAFLDIPTPAEVSCCCLLPKYYCLHRRTLEIGVMLGWIAASCFALIVLKDLIAHIPCQFFCKREKPMQLFARQKLLAFVTSCHKHGMLSALIYQPLTPRNYLHVQVIKDNFYGPPFTWHAS